LVQFLIDRRNEAQAAADNHKPGQGRRDENGALIMSAGEVKAETAL
jgi:hypothetical protein